MKVFNREEDQTLQPLQKKVNSLEMVLERISAGVINIDSNFEIIYINEKAKQMLHIYESLLEGTRILDVIPIEMYQLFNENLLKSVSSGDMVLFRFLSPWSYKDSLSLKVYPFEGGLSLFMEGESASKEIMKTLDEHHKKLMILSDTTKHLLSDQKPKQILDNLFQDLSTYLNLDVYLHFILNEKTNKLELVGHKGIPVEEADQFKILQMGDSVSGCVARDKCSIVVEDINQSLDPDLDILRKLGIISYAGLPLLSFGKFIGTLSFGSKRRLAFQPEELDLIQLICNQIAVTLDRIILISELKEKNDELVKSNNKLVKSRKKFAKLFDSVPFPMSITAIDDGTIFEVNGAFLESNSLKRSEVINQNIFSLDIWEDRSVRDQILEIAKKDGKLVNLKTTINFKNIGPKIGLLSGVRIELDEIPCFLCIFHDISEYEQFKNNLQRLDQLNLVGEMAAGIGHEIRNPMTTIRGFLQILSDKYLDSEDRLYFAIMIDELDRANSIISEFLHLAKNSLVKLEKHNLNMIIHKIIPLLEADAVVSSKKIVTALKRLPDIEVDEKQIRQLIINLVRNGLDEINDGESITINTYAHEDHVILEVIDEGPGIPSEIMNNLGKPFFTTKEKGTGLGLPICFSIANKHNATISFNSNPTGTTVQVKFPVTGGLSPQGTLKR